MPLEVKTVEDFGDQWTKYSDDNHGYYGSTELLQDVLGELDTIDIFKGKRVIDIGSGTGRIVKMLVAAGAEHVYAIEPSKAFGPLLENTKLIKDQVTYFNILGESTPNLSADIAISLGVIHHIENPSSTMKSAYDALICKGKIILWLYGYEGNEIYLAFFRPIRVITTRLPHFLLHWLSVGLNFFLGFYILCCKILPLPMKSYMLNHVSRLSQKVRLITIYDQLNPKYAKYYTRQEALNLMTNAGFKDIQIYHRHGYSWTVVGTK